MMGRAWAPGMKAGVPEPLFPHSGMRVVPDVELSADQVRAYLEREL